MYQRPEKINHQRTDYNACKVQVLEVFTVSQSQIPQDHADYRYMYDKFIGEKEKENEKGI